MGRDDERAFRWAFFAACCDAVRATATALGDSVEGLVAIKGVHIGLLLSDPTRRAMADVDVVVVGDFDRGVDRLRRASWTLGEDHHHSMTAWTPRGIGVDLHRRPLPAHFGTLDAEALWRGGAANSRLGPRVRVPSLEDAAVLTLSHFVKDRLGLYGGSNADSDLAALAASGVGPIAVEARLREVGLHRVGLAALAALAPRSDVAEEWLHAFRATRIERAAANGVALTLARTGRHPRASAWLVRALPDRAREGALGLLSQFRESVARRVT